MKKFLSLLLLTALLLSVLCSCGERKPDDPDTDPASQESADGEYPDYSEYTFTIAAVTSRMESLRRDVVLPEEVPDTVTDICAKRFKAAEDAFHTKFDYLWGSVEQVTDKLTASFLSCALCADILAHNSKLVRQWQAQGFTYDLKELDGAGIDLSNTEKYGSPERQLLTTTPDGVQYAIPYRGSAYWPSNYSFHGTLFVNNENLARTDAVRPQELVEKHQWTFDTFKENLHSYTIDEGDGNVIPALILSHHDNPRLAYCALFANGADFITNENGHMTFAMNTPEALAALEWATEIYGRKDDVAVVTKADDPTFSSGGGVLFLTNSVRGLSTLNDWEIQKNLKDFSWLPFPTGPSYDNRTSTSYFFSSTVDCTALADGEKVEETSVVYDYLFEPLTDFGEDGYSGYMRNNFFFDDASFEVYTDMLNRTHIFWDHAVDSATMNVFTTSVKSMLEREKTPIEVIETFADRIQAELDSDTNG